LPPYRLRPAVRDDVPACVEVFHRSFEALQASRHEAIAPRNSPPLARLFEHLVATDPDGAWVAEAAGSVAGFALAHRRGRRWFLGFLFVLQEWQGAGMGRALLEQALPRPEDRDGMTLGVCAEAIQPVSTALYARAGMVPRTPIYLLAGPLRLDALPLRPDRLGATLLSALDGDDRAPGTGSPLGAAALEAVARVDRELMEAERPQDHRMWRETGRLGFLFHRPGPHDAADATLGYGYVQPSGRIGPVLLREPALLGPALAELTAALAPPGAWQAIVPGPAAHALVPLLAGGMRIEGGPAVYAADWDGPPFDRYLPMNFALI
jgi:GNAT superfamily N-acetyltransferase